MSHSISGWILPTNTLIQKDLIAPKLCDSWSAMSEFFTSGSCVPGVRNQIKKVSPLVSQKLCSLCLGLSICKY